MGWSVRVRLKEMRDHIINSVWSLFHLKKKSDNCKQHLCNPLSETAQEHGKLVDQRPDTNSHTEGTGGSRSRAPKCITTVYIVV